MDIVPVSNNQTFDTGAQAVGTGSLTQIGRLRAFGRKVVLHGQVGSGGALNHLTIQMAATPDGTMKNLAVDTDFGTTPLPAAIPVVLGTNIYQTAANGDFMIVLDAGAYEYNILAQGAAATTLEISGTIINTLQP